MPVFRNVSTVRRSRRLSNRPPPVDPEFEYYDLALLSLSDPEANAASSRGATPDTASAVYTPPSTLSVDDDIDSDIFVPRSSHSRKRKEGHIPRPPNAFLFYRSWYWSQEKTKTTVERDHRKISRIAGHLWRTSLTEDEKQPFKELAAEEKERHSKLYPGYKYSPVYRNKTSKKKVKHDASFEQRRCKKLADLLYKGVEGKDLEEFANRIDDEADTSPIKKEPKHERIPSSRGSTRSPYAATSRRRNASTTSKTKKLSSKRGATQRSPAPEPASPTVKEETMASPKLLCSPNEAPTGYVPTEDIPPLSLSDSDDQAISSLPTLAIPEMEPAYGGWGPDAARLSLLQPHEYFSPSSPLSLSPPSSYPSLHTQPQIASFANPYPWETPFMVPNHTDDLFSAEAEFPVPSPEDIMNEYLNLDYEV